MITKITTIKYFKVQNQNQIVRSRRIIKKQIVFHNQKMKELCNIFWNMKIRVSLNQNGEIGLKNNMLKCEI